MTCPVAEPHLGISLRMIVYVLDLFSVPCCGLRVKVLCVCYEREEKSPAYIWSEYTPKKLKTDQVLVKCDS